MDRSAIPADTSPLVLANNGQAPNRPRGTWLGQRLVIRRERPLALAVTLLTLLLASCSAIPRLPAPPQVLRAPAPTGFPPDVRQVGMDSARTVGAFNRWLSQLRPRPDGEPLHILALSGGGAGSAFGAGALVGLSRAGMRPRFDVVTGVSAGALLAPFAFLGAGWDAELTAAFDGGVAQNLLQFAGLRVLFRPGVYDGKPLVDLVDRFVTDRLIRAVAAEAATGRILLVATTDLDTEETVIWDMGRIAALGGERARTLFRDVLVASSSIPGVFPPVIMRVGGSGEAFDEVHVDGGTTTPFFVTPEAGLIRLQPNELLEGAEVYVLVNGQLNVQPMTTTMRPIAIISRGFAAGLMHSSRKSLELTAALANRLDLDLRFSSIPATYAYQGALDFGHDTMHALFQYGARCAASGHLWVTVDQAIDRFDQHANAHAGQEDDCPAG